MTMLNAEEKEIVISDDHESKIAVNNNKDSNEMLANEESKETIVRLCRSHSIVLHKFPPLNREKAQLKLVKDGFKVLNSMPNASCKDKIIVVSHDGSFKHASTSSRPVVNPLWIEIVDTNSPSNLSKYTFALKGLSFMVYGKASFNGKIEAEIELWR